MNKTTKKTNTGVSKTKIRFTTKTPTTQFTKQIRKVGNSHVVTIPTNIMKENKLKEKQEVTLKVISKE